VPARSDQYKCEKIAIDRFKTIWNHAAQFIMPMSTLIFSADTDIHCLNERILSVVYLCQHSVMLAARWKEDHVTVPWHFSPWQTPRVTRTICSRTIMYSVTCKICPQQDWMKHRVKDWKREYYNCYRHMKWTSFDQ